MIMVYSTIQEHQIYIQYVVFMHPQGMNMITFLFSTSFISYSIFMQVKDTYCSSILITTCYFYVAFSFPKIYILTN